VIQAEQFVEAGRRRGLEWYAGVPCSFLAPFINCVINDDRLTYVSSVNEGDALATAAGAVIGGRRAGVMMQNSGLGNAVNPLTSLAYVFRIPLLLICTLRGDPEFKDEPQHVLMGRITGRLFETMEVPWELFPAEAAEIEPVLDRAEEYFAKDRRPYALIMRKGSVAPHPLRKETVSQRRQGDRGTERFYSGKDDARPTRNQALRRIIELSPEKGTVVVATTGYTGRELFALNDRANQLCMVGSMGCASSLGLGLALARPDLRVIVIDGDGAALMRMGNFATIGAYAGPNLIHIVLDNEAHDSTGAQGTVSAQVSFAGIAAACGYRVVMEGDDLALLDALFAGPSGSGPRFGHLKIRPGTIQGLPRPTVSPREALERLMAHIGSRS
jgi:phosphonopyruvate decarboxylase